MAPKVSTNQPESSRAHFVDNLKWHNHIYQTQICALYRIENKILQKHKVKLYQTLLKPTIEDMAMLYKNMTTVPRVNNKNIYE